mgnify:CR=1 FL=1
MQRFASAIGSIAPLMLVTIMSTTPAHAADLTAQALELVKDCEDVEGDGTCGARTVPVVSGRAAAMNMAAAIFILLAAAFPVPYFAGIYNHAYAAIMLISVLPILAISSIFALRGRNPGLISAMLKVGMYFGIAAFLLGTIM